MGAIAEAIVAYAQPLIDQTDGSIEQLNKALATSQLCYNLALLTEDEQQKHISELKGKLSLDEEEFESFRDTLIMPMIRRHHQMFPRFREWIASGLSAKVSSSPNEYGKVATAEEYAGTDRYALCPCNSGRKYKFCCGSKSR